MGPGFRRGDVRRDDGGGYGRVEDGETVVDVEGAGSLDDRDVGGRRLRLVLAVAGAVVGVGDLAAVRVGGIGRVGDGLEAVGGVVGVGREFWLVDPGFRRGDGIGRRRSLLHGDAQQMQRHFLPLRSDFACGADARGTPIEARAVLDQGEALRDQPVM